METSSQSFEDRRRPRIRPGLIVENKKGAQVLVEGSLVSSTYERENGKGKKSAPLKLTS